MTEACDVEFLRSAQKSIDCKSVMRTFESTKGGIRHGKEESYQEAGQKEGSQEALSALGNRARGPMIPPGLSDGRTIQMFRQCQAPTWARGIE